MEFDLLGINKTPLGKDKQGDESVQSYGRKYDVSPIFSFGNTAEIAVSEEVVVDFETLKPASAKYLPFNTLNILNNSSVPILIYINQKRDRPMIVPAGVIQPIDNTIAPAISSVLYKNTSTTATIAIGEIQFLASKDNVTEDLLIKRVHKLLFGGRGLTRR